MNRLLRPVAVALIVFGVISFALGIGYVIEELILRPESLRVGFIRGTLMESLPFVVSGLLLLAVGFIAKSVDEIASHFRAQTEAGDDA